MKRKHNNKNGFTLIEVLIALTISTLLISGVLSLMQPADRMNYETQRLKVQREIVRTVNTGISERVRFATEVIIVKNTDSEPDYGADYIGHSVLWIDNSEKEFQGNKVRGRVYYKNYASDADFIPMLSDGFYSMYSCDIKASKDNYNLALDFNLYRLKKTTGIEDLYSVRNVTRLKNFSFDGSTYIFKEADASTMSGQPIPGLTIKGPGTNTYILYKK